MIGLAKRLERDAQVESLLRIRKGELGLPPMHTCSHYQVLRGLYIQGTVAHVGSRPLLDDNSIYLPGYTRFDPGGRYRTDISGKAVTFRLSVDNVANKFYYASATYGTPGYGQPRTVRGSVSVDF